MKKIFVLSVCMLATGQVFAANACATILAASPAQFIVRDFTPKCSSNVTAVYLENTVAVAVGAVSSKGKSRFQGTSGGGAISGQPCAGATCVADDASAGLQDKLNSAT